MDFIWKLVSSHVCSITIHNMHLYVALLVQCTSNKNVLDTNNGNNSQITNILQRSFSEIKTQIMLLYIVEG